MPDLLRPDLSKLIAWEDRRSSIDRMRRALSEYAISGIKTTLPFFGWLLEQRAFVVARFTSYLDEILRSKRRTVPASARCRGRRGHCRRLHAVLSLSTNSGPPVVDQPLESSSAVEGCATSAPCDRLPPPIRGQTMNTPFLVVCGSHRAVGRAAIATSAPARAQAPPD
jgi:hypothetical protein